MGNKVPLTFNTVKHSNREKRLKRKQTQRALILCMVALLALLIVCGLVFAVCSLVAYITRDTSPVGTIEYQDFTKFSTDIESGTLSVINQDYRIEKLPTDLVTMTAPKIDGEPTYLLARTVQIHPDAQAAFDAMMTEYYNIFGSDESITVRDAFRSLEDQSGRSIPAGYSDHHSGYLLTLNILSSQKPDHWIFKNCHKYGFVVRYPKDKAAQTKIDIDYTEAIRYVGVAHATYMKENNLCLEEYVRQLQETTPEKQIQVNGADGLLYSAYYIPSSTAQLTQFKVPSNYAYEISGDNVGGFIVTVKLSEPIE